MGKFGVSELQNPEPIERKFGTGYYISDTTSYAKIQKDRPSGGVWAPFFFVIEFLLTPPAKTAPAIFMCLWFW